MLYQLTSEPVRPPRAQKKRKVLFEDGTPAVGELKLGEAFDPVSLEKPWLGMYSDEETLSVELHFVGKTLDGRPVDVQHRIGAPGTLQPVDGDWDENKAFVGEIYFKQILTLRGLQGLEDWHDLEGPCAVTLTQWGDPDRRRQGFKDIRPPAQATTTPRKRWRE